MSETAFQKRSLAEQVADSLATTIDRHGWQTGRRLPPVRDLAQQFDVSSYTAHCAVQLLVKRGVVGIRPRKGAFVQEGVEKPERAPAVRNHIGIVWPCQPDPQFTMDLDNWMARILRAAEMELHEVGYYTTVLGYLKSPQFFERMEPMRPHLAGILTFAGDTIPPLLDRLDQWDVPWITVNAPFANAVHNFVAADNHRDCARVGHAMAQAGIRRVWVLSSHFSPANSNMDKILGLCEGFILAGAPIGGIDIVTCDVSDEPNGCQAMRRQLERSDRPQVVFTSGDTLALGAIRACREAGLRVPEDVGVIGATGLRLAELSHPSLSVITQPMEEMGRQAGQMLIEMAREGVRRLVGRRIPGQFIQRQSFALPLQQEISVPPGVPAADVKTGVALRPC